MDEKEKTEKLKDFISGFMNSMIQIAKSNDSEEQEAERNKCLENTKSVINDGILAPNIGLIEIINQVGDEKFEKNDSEEDE